ncbi:MAG TPA: hypothetical protein VM694_43430 [Polyangium sp.]|jgi:hypothetical protein|nr:hypothetical protein [Polyangium sp.]
MKKQHTLDSVQWGFLVAHAWAEASFRQQLEQNPSGTIRTFAKQQFGLEIDHDVALPLDLPLPPADLAIEALTLGMGLGPAPATGCGCGTAGEVHSGAQRN